MTDRPIPDALDEHGYQAKVMGGFEARHDLAVVVDLWLKNPDFGWEPAEAAVRAICDDDFLAVSLAALVEAHGRNKVLRALGGSFDCGELDDDEAWVQVWSFPEDGDR